MGKYDTILFGEQNTRPEYKTKYDDILFGTTQQPAEEPAGEVVSETQENSVQTQQLPTTTTADYLTAYGVSEDKGNTISYNDLNAKMEADGVDTNTRREIQQSWFKGYQKYIDSLIDENEKKAHQEHLAKLMEIPATYQENTELNQAKENWTRGIVGTEAVAEGVKNTASSYLDLSDEQLLAKYNPELLQKIKAVGGVDHIRNVGVALKNQESDLSGMGSTALMGTSQTERNLGEELLNTLSDLRTRDALARTDKEGEEVVMQDGTVKKMSNLQAADYYNKAPSSIAGEKEAAEAFEKDPWGSLVTGDGISHLVGAAFRSTAQNLPTTIAGTAAMFFNPAVGLAIINSGNITDQQLQGVQELADKEYKKLNGEDANVTDLSADEYLKFLDKLADEGKVSNAVADGFKTGLGMTLAEQATAGVVGKLGSQLAGMSAKTLAGRLAAGGAAVGIKATDEGWQEVASQIVENVSNGKPWNENTAQAFIQGTFSLENVAQHAGNIGNKFVEKQKAQQKNEEAEPTTEQSAVEPQEESAVEQPTNYVDVDEANRAFEEAREEPGQSAVESSVEPQGETPSREQLLAEYDALTRKVGDGVASAEDAQRIQDIESEFTTTTKNEKGQTVTRNNFNEVYRAWQTGTGEFAKQQDTENENRKSNRDGQEDVNGQPNEQGTVSTNTVGEKRSSETSEPVSPVETKTTTAGNSQSDTGIVTDITEQPNHNTPESNPVGSDGRTGETVSGRREQRELGQEGSQQSSEPSQTSVAGSTDSGVRERTQSDSVGETLTPVKTEREQIADAIVSEIKAIKGKPTVDDVFAIHEKISQNKMRRVHNVHEAYHKLLDKLTNEQDVELTERILRSAEKKREDFNSKVEELTNGRISPSKRGTVVTEQTIEQSTVPNKTTKISAADLNSSRKTDAAKTGNAEQKPSVTDSKVEKENAKRRAIESAVASEKERISPEPKFTKEFKGNDLRTNQRIAHELLKGADEKTAEEIRDAFFKNSPTASTASFEAAKRGYLRPNARNPKHQAFAGSRVDLVGFDFNDNPVYKDQEVVYNDIKKSTAIEDKVTELLANPDLVEDITAFHKKAVDDAFNVKYLEGKRERVLTEALPFIKDVEGKPITDTAKVTDGDLVALAIDEEAKKGIDVKSLLGRFLKRLNALLSAVVAVVGVSAMTIPQDAYAQAGFATYESGPQIAGVSQEASNTINWVKATHDNNGKVFVVADKNEGKIHVVDNNGKVIDTQNAIFGRNKSNDNVANSTPSGRFKLQKALTTKAVDKKVFGSDVLTLTDAVTGKDITKADGGVIAMHRLWNKPERVKAINSATATDNYMSAGCINVPTAFYNSAVDNLDGAMVYILDNKDAPKSGNATQKVAKSSTNTTTESTKTTPTKQGKFGISKVKFSTADFKVLDTSLTAEKVKSTLKKVLGEHAKNVTVISRADFNSVQAQHYILKNGIEGFYDPSTGAVFIVADGVHSQNGLSAEDRVGFVAWHELTHLGLDTKYGEELRGILETASANSTIAELAEKIQLERVNRGEEVSVNDAMAVEEALAELNAALKTDNVKALEDRYGVTIPKGLRSQAEKATDNLFDRIRNVVRRVLGKPVMTNEQVRNLFAGLDEAIAKHSAPESVAVTARLNELSHNVEAGVNLNVDYSIKSAIKAIRDTIDPYVDILADRATGEKHTDKIADPAGFNPNSIDTTVTQKQKVKGNLSPYERFFEAFADSQYSAIKYIGGYNTALAHKIKTTVNAIAHKQREFQKRIFAFSDEMRKAAKSRPDLYTRKNRHAIDTDVMVATTALSAVTKSTHAMSSNEAIKDKYIRLLDGYDYTDQHGNVYHKNGLREELAAYGYDPVNQQANVYTPYQMKRLSDMLAKVKEYEEILNTFDQNKNELLNEAGLSHADALVQRKNWRGHNGMTNADAYNAITKAVEQGKLDITYDGKPWLDYIRDIGFTKDVGFADKTKNYELSYDKLKVDGFLSPMINKYVDIAKSFYKYQYDNLGHDLTGPLNENPFFTPTMGKASDIKTKSNMVGDTFYLDESRGIEDRINDAVAAEWQGQHLGRAWTGSGTLTNLNALAALSAKRVGQTEVGNEIYKLGQLEAFKIRVVTTTDPNFGEAKGYLITRKNKNGYSQYIKVSLDNDRANNALFLDNVVTPNNALLDVARSVRGIFSVMITMMPAFSFYNAWKGFGEKRSQIKAFALNNKVGYFFSDLKDQSDGLRLQFAADLFARSYKNALSGMFGKGYLRGALLLALEEGDKNPKTSALRDWLVKSPDAKLAYDRLKQIANAGGISSRADSFKFSTEELQRAYEKGGITGAISRNIANAQSRALTLTTAMEMVSTLATVDTLQEMGLSQKKAIEANLWFMNFNDKGASALSSIMRSVVPFANATAQGARSTVRSLETKNGQVNFMRQAIFRSAYMAVAALAMEMFPCEDGGEKETLRDYNSGELMRSTPIKIGCFGTLRMPIAYGADMISAALGTAAYQFASGNWDLGTSWKHVVHAVSENVNVAPTPPGESNIFEIAVAPVTPRVVQVMYNVLRDKDDFGNKLSRQGSDNLKEKWAAGKNTTADAWTMLARGFDATGINVTPEQARYLTASFAPPLANLVDALDKPLATKAEKDNPAATRFVKVAKALVGTKTALKDQQSPSQRTYAQVNNNLARYEKITKVINVAAERKELKFGSDSANTQSWLKKRIEDGTFSKDQEAKVKVILDYQKRQKRISSSALSTDKKNEKYYESNLRYLKEMHELEDQ